MHSWKTIRTISAILILVPIVHMAYLISRDTLASLDASPTAWSDEVEEYALLDRDVDLPDKPIVVVGGRSVRLWRDLADLLAPTPVLMRGLGDAIIDDIIYFYQPLIDYYQPAAIVLLPSRSEFHIRDAKSAEQLVDGIQKLFELDNSHNGYRQLYVFAPIKSIKSPGDYQKIDRVTLLLQAWAKTKMRLTVLDANPLLSNVEGRPKANYFLSDGQNLNEHGYLRLGLLLREQLEKDTITALEITPTSAGATSGSN